MNLPSSPKGRKEDSRHGERRKANDRAPFGNNRRCRRVTPAPGMRIPPWWRRRQGSAEGEPNRDHGKPRPGGHSGRKTMGSPRTETMNRSASHERQPGESITSRGGQQARVPSSPARCRWHSAQRTTPCIQRGSRSHRGSSVSASASIQNMRGGRTERKFEAAQGRLRRNSQANRTRSSGCIDEVTDISQLY